MDIYKAHTKLVYIVEDDPVVVQFLSDRLRNEGYSVEFFLNGEDLCQRMMYRPDYVVLDYYLKDYDGRDLLEYIKEIYPDVPVIGFSRMNNKEEITRLFSRGLDYYIIKSPKGVDEVVEIIEQLRIGKKVR